LVFPGDEIVVKKLWKYVESPKDDFTIVVEIKIKSKVLNAINILIKDTIIPFVKRFTNLHEC